MPFIELTLSGNAIKDYAIEISTIPRSSKSMKIRNDVGLISGGIIMYNSMNNALYL